MSMLQLETTKSTNPLTDVSDLARHWFIWGALSGASLLFCCQRVVATIAEAVNAAESARHDGSAPPGPEPSSGRSNPGGPPPRTAPPPNDPRSGPNDSDIVPAPIPMPLPTPTPVPTPTAHD